MSEKIKSGKDVIDDFFREILDIEGVDRMTVEKLVKLYEEKKLSDRNIQNALEELNREALAQESIENNED